jgi:hydroxymethylpyrimidine/phosphomethylpyrimidine kinase
LLSCALTIAGLDPCSGAGLTADLRWFQVAGVWGCSVCSLLTVQSTRGLQRTQLVPAELVYAQAHEIITNHPVQVIKTGALGSADNVKVVQRLKKQFPHLGLIVDPVMLASKHQGTKKLLSSSGQKALLKLCSVATLVTPNLPELEALVGTKLPSREQRTRACEQLLSLGAQAVLLKGGHLTGHWAEDLLIFRTGHRVWLRTPRIDLPDVHGTGCCLASLIAGFLAKSGDFGEDNIKQACCWAKTTMYQRLLSAKQVGTGQWVLP